MFILHVDLSVKPGVAKALKALIEMYLCQRSLNKRGSQKRNCSGPYPPKPTATGL